jgi:hypothetical protein
VTSSTHAPHSTVVQKHSEVIHTNQRHPFLTLEHGFVPVSQLTLGMQVLNADGTVETVTGWKVVPGTQVMYHLDVAQDHTYTVGAGEWVVHNCGIPGQAEARAREIGASIDALVGKWNRSALTVGTAIVDDSSGGYRTLIATNEKASGSLSRLVQSQIRPGEEFVSLADKQGRNAEEVLYEYAQRNGLNIRGIGASNDFCSSCRSLLTRGLGPGVLGQ